MESNSMDPRVREVLRIIDNELDGDLSVNTLAKRIHLSPSRLAHLFKTTTAMSLVKWVRQRRLASAANLLSGSALSVKQVVVAAGFKNPRYFARLFKRTVTVSPKQFREQYSRKRAPHVV